MKTCKPRTLHRRGFSLVELLVVLAVIGILSAVVIPVLSSNNLAAENAVARRNAQAIASLNMQAVSIGAPEIRGVTNPETIIEKLMLGVRGSGAMSQITVQLSGMSEEDIDSAMHFLEPRDGVLVTKTQ